MNYFENIIMEEKAILSEIINISDKLQQIAIEIVNRLQCGGKILWIGNGGSAADCQHFSAELVGKYLIKRVPIASIALSSDNTIITALGNDLGYETIFNRQIEALGNKNDVLIALTTSGKSKNIINAIATAQNKNIYTVLITGQSGSALIGGLASSYIAIPSDSVPRIQETYFVVCHTLCQYIENKLLR